MHTSSALPQDPDHTALRLSYALLASLLLHGVALMLLFFARYVRPDVMSEPLLDVDLVSLPPPAQVAPRPAPAVPPPPQAPQDATAENPPAPELALPQRQIVNPPDEGKEEPPKDTRLLSDRDNTVDREMVHRGEPRGGESAQRQAEPAPASKPAQRASRDRAPPKPRAPQRVARAPQAVPPSGAGATSQNRVARAPRFDELLPDASTLAREGSLPSESPAADGSSEKKGEQRNVLKYADLWSPPGGTGGTLDFLPDVREGDVTLLNTKAELFAPFVRRVAQRVFQNQIISLRRELGSAGTSAQESVTVEAIMDKRGKPVSLRITDRSTTGATGIDRHLQRACQQAFFDLNPPRGAEAADGNIHFVFRTQVRVAVAPNGLVRYGALLMAGLM